MSWLEFECMIMDEIENKGIKNGKELSSFIDEIHQHIEIAAQDYASDEGFYDDYEPCY